MKQLTCDMCGSIDLIKDGGVFVCQTCGCKYSIEEAKRMMIEGTVDVQGTVKVDNSAFVEKYLANARRAKEKEDWEETEKYYNMVEQNDPDNIEAIFYSAYGKAKSTLVDGDLYKRQVAFKVLTNCISVIDDHYQIERAEENRKAIEDIAKDLSAMFFSNFVFTEWKNGYGVVTKTNKNETYELFSRLVVQFRESILNIAKVDDHAYLHESLKLTYAAILLLKDVWNENFKNRIKGWQKEADERIAAVRTKMIDKYWSEHVDEKAALDNELSGLKDNVTAKQIEIENLYETNVLKDLEDQVAALKKEKDGLGLFKGKEKKALQEQIDALNIKVKDATTAKSAAVAPFNAEIANMQKRIDEINAELTKDR